MNRKQALAGLILCTTPLLSFAQNSNTPGGQASTGTPIEQIKTSPHKPMAHKQAGDNAMSPSSTDDSMMKKKSHSKMKNQTPAGDVPTYPAPAPDGKPTK